MNFKYILIYKKKSIPFYRALLKLLNIIIIIGHFIILMFKDKKDVCVWETMKEECLDKKLVPIMLL